MIILEGEYKGELIEELSTEHLELLKHTYKDPHILIEIELELQSREDEGHKHYFWNNIR